MGRRKNVIELYYRIMQQSIILMTSKVMPPHAQHFHHIANETHVSNSNLIQPNRF